MGMAAMLDACGNGPDTKKAEVTATPTPFTGRGEIDLYYPELAGRGLVPISSEVLTGLSAPTAVFDYIPRTELNFRSITNVYNYLDTGRIAPVYQGNIFIENKPVDVVFFKKNLKSRVVAFVPKDAPYPAWIVTHQEAKDFDAATRVGHDGRMTSYVRDVASPDPEKSLQTTYRNLTLAFVVEACQETFSGRFSDQNGQLLSDENNVFLAQELWCNSFGMALASRILGYTYDEYVKYVSSNSINIKGYVKDFPMLRLLPESYRALPIFAPIVAVK